MIIAIDPGYANLGYAIGKDNELIDYGTLYFKAKDRLREIYEKVNELFMRYNAEEVFIEDFRVYREDIRGKHKTAMAIGIITAVCFEHGAKVQLINHKTWKAEFNRLFFFVEPRLDEKWKEALQNGSEHSRDAVMMLLPKVVDLRRLVRGGVK